MKKLSIKLWAFIAIIAMGTISISSCDDDDSTAAPMVSLSTSTFEGNIGESVSTTVSADIDGSFKELRITKYLGTDVDNSYGTDGTQTITSALPYNFSYTLNAEGAETPVRFRFVVEDNNGQTDEENLVITTKLTLAYVLTNFDWRWNSQLGKAFDADPIAEQIRDCEKDNVFTFNTDGTMSIDYGALTGAGGGSCDFDGLTPYVSYSISADESTITLVKDDAFNPGNFTEEVLTVQSYNLVDLVTTTPVDLTVFGGILSDWTFSYKAQAK